MLLQMIGFLVVALLLAQLFATAYRKVSEAQAINQIAIVETSYLRRLTEEAEMRTRVQRERIDSAWHGWRKFRVLSIADETDAVKSFYLVPHDKKPLPPFLPGQYLTLQVRPPDQMKPLIRCYSLSCSPSQDFYRISVKQEGAGPGAPERPPGLVSTFLHEKVNEGDFIDVKSPGGAFYLDLSRHTPVVLIAGGIGITPIFSMLDSIVAQGSKREVWFFLGVRSRGDHPMYGPLIDYAKRVENLRLVVCYSDPSPSCRQGIDYHHHGVVSVSLMRDMLNANNYDFYFCGPPGMMEALHSGLRDWGVPNDRLHYEAFGPATVNSLVKNDDPKDFKISFIRSKKDISWSNNSGSILDVAEANGIRVDSGCRSGNCGACAIAIKSGAIDYLNVPGQPPEEGTCLICSAVPTSNLELDA
ncbi:MAG: 2Fe-2S iron-sulfur cluster-binding protein [Geminicoccales bacterium]